VKRFGGTTLRARLAGSVQSLSPESAALVLAVGVTLGLFPIYGCSTILCAAASVILGLNVPAVQLVNQLATPLQLAMLWPLARLGARILNAPGGPAFAGSLGISVLQAVAGWVSLCVPLGILLYFTLAYVLRRFESAKGSGSANPGSHTPRSFASPRLARGRA
jgi:uncharacterized protein (DUF2062 family)